MERYVWKCCTHAKRWCPLILSLFRIFYFSDPNTKTDTFRVGFIRTFLPCFSFVIKGVWASFSPLLQCQIQTADLLQDSSLWDIVLSVAVSDALWSQWLFVLHSMPAGVPTASSASLILYSHAEGTCHCEMQGMSACSGKLWWAHYPKVNH